MSSPKPIPTRRGTLFGLRRKSSVASLTPSVPVVASVTDAPLIAEPSSSALVQESASTEPTVSGSARLSPPKPRRGFSLIPTRTSTDVPPSETSAPLSDDAGSDHSLNVYPKPNSSRNFLRRLSSSSRGKHAFQIEELQQAKAALEEQVAILTTEKSTLQAALESAKAESSRVALEVETGKSTQDEERTKIIDEAAAQLVAKEAEMKSLLATIEEMRDELEKVKASEQKLLAQSLSASLDAEAKVTEAEERVRAEAKEEREVLENQLVEAQTSLDAKDRAIKELEGEAFGLKEKLAVAEMEVRRLKEAKAICETEKAKMLSRTMPSPTKPKGGWFSASGWCNAAFSWLTYGYVRSMADESSRYGSRHPACLYLA